MTSIEGVRRDCGKVVQETVDICIHITDAGKDWRLKAKGEAGSRG